MTCLLKNRFKKIVTYPNEQIPIVTPVVGVELLLVSCIARERKWVCRSPCCSDGER